MCYVFDSLQENFLLNQEVPSPDDSCLHALTSRSELRRYQFDVTEISADQMTPDGLHTWQYKDEDIDKLKNPQKSVVHHQSEQSAQLRAESGDCRTYCQHRKE